MSPQASRRILLIKTGAIGDVLMTTPAVRAVRVAFPRAHISYLVGRRSGDVLLNNPHIDEVITFDDDIFLKRRYVEFLKLTAFLRGKKFDTVIAFHLNKLVHLFSYLIGASRRVAISGGGGRYLTHWLGLSGRESMQPVDLNMAILSAAGIKVGPYPMELFFSESERRYAVEFKYRHLGGGRPVVGLFPGCGNPASWFTHRRWGIENFNHLCRGILAHYPGSRVMVFGSGDEKGLSSRLIRHQSVVDLIGRTTLREAISLMSILDLAVTNDSSSLHFGTVLKIPTVSLFGPSSAGKYAKEEGPLHKFLAARLPCCPCEDTNGRFVSGCKDNICMASIQPETVFDACTALLGPPFKETAVEAVL